MRICKYRQLCRSVHLRAFTFLKSLSLLFLASLFEALKTPHYTLTLQKKIKYTSNHKQRQKNMSIDLLINFFNFLI